MILTCLRETLAFATCFWLDSVVVLTLLISFIASLSRPSSAVTFGATHFCPVEFSLFGGVSGITVPERGSMVLWGGVALIIGVFRGLIGEWRTLIFEGKQTAAGPNWSAAAGFIKWRRV